MENKEFNYEPIAFRHINEGNTWSLQKGSAQKYYSIIDVLEAFYQSLEIKVDYKYLIDPKKGVIYKVEEQEIKPTFYSIYGSFKQGI